MKKRRLAGRVLHSALRTPHSALAIAIALLCLSPPPANSQEIPRQHHAWARFAAGSWKLVRIVTENFDAQGRVSGASVTETTTTLKHADAEGFSLLIESTVELDGKQLVAEPQQVTQRYTGALAGQTASSRLVGEEAVTIDGTSYPCRVHQYEISSVGHKTVTRTHYSAATAPYVLHRETTAIETAGNTVTSRVVVEVRELNVPHVAGGQTHQAARMRVQQKHAKGTETTNALSSVRVPGGVIWHDSTLVDTNEGKLSHSKLELVDYHVVERAPPPRDAGLLRLSPALGYRQEMCSSFCRGSVSSRYRFTRCGN